MSELYDGPYDAPMFEAVAAGESDGETVEITRAFPASEKVKAGDLRVGDRVFTVFGGPTLALTKVTRRPRGWVDTVREDGWTDRFHQTDTITIVREV